MFGSAKEGDKLVDSDFPCEDNVDIHSVGVMTVDEQIDFCNQEMQDDCFLSTIDEDVIDIDGDENVDEDVVDIDVDKDVEEDIINTD